MELLSQGAMVERFERKKMAVKNKLNDLVDDLFAFMLSEVTTIVPPSSSVMHPVMATSGGATITVVPSIIPSVKSTNLTPSSSSSANPVIGNGVGTTFTMLKPVSKPATAHLAMKVTTQPKVKEEVPEEEDEEGLDEEEDEYDEEDISSQISSGRTPVVLRMKASPSSSSQTMGGTGGVQRVQSVSQNNHNHHHQHHHHHHHPSGFCDSDSDSCECYDCMDESMVKVEMEENDDDSDNSDNLGRHFYQTTGESGPKRKRQRTSEGGGLDGDGMSNVDEEEETESVGNNHQIDILGLKCWYGDCQAMLEDRTKLNQHLYFEHDKTLPYQCRVVGCGMQFDVRKDFWAHIRTGHTDFTCSICSIKFNGYFPFVTHEFQQHEEGIFKCRRDDCDFVAAVRDLVYKHAKTEHVKFVCTFNGCDATFECYSYLKRHRRIHSQVKPYRCKWPNCGYSSTQCGAVIQHIRIRHFKLPSSVKKQKEMNIIDHRNPNDYLQVITELLN